MTVGPIVIIDDDPDDKDLLNQVFDELEIKNERIFFFNTKDAMNYLKATLQQPFIIFCDINMPGENGLKFKEKIDADRELRRKSIPFIFYSTAAGQQEVNKAYDQLLVQGFFIKETEYGKIKEDIQMIIGYWARCRHPNSTPV
jgi:CheY-like chemotaxis protein